jgi:hypothetical protein
LARRRARSASKAKTRDVDLLHDPAQQRVGLERPQPLLPQGFLKGVDFAADGAQDVVTLLFPGPEREVPFAQTGEQIGDDL